MPRIIGTNVIKNEDGFSFFRGSPNEIRIVRVFNHNAYDIHDGYYIVVEEKQTDSMGVDSWRALPQDLVMQTLLNMYSRLIPINDKDDTESDVYETSQAQKTTARRAKRAKTSSKKR